MTHQVSCIPAQFRDPLLLQWLSVQRLSSKKVSMKTRNVSTHILHKRPRYGQTAPAWVLHLAIYHVFFKVHPSPYLAHTFMSPYAKQRKLLNYTLFCLDPRQIPFTMVMFGLSLIRKETYAYWSNYPAIWITLYRIACTVRENFTYYQIL